MGITIPESVGKKRTKDNEEEDEEDPTDLRGKRPVGTRTKKLIGNGVSKNLANPLVDKDDNPLLVPMTKKKEEEHLRETMKKSLVEKHTPYLPFFEDQGVTLQHRLMEEQLSERYI